MRVETLAGVLVSLCAMTGCAGLGVVVVGNDETTIVNPRMSSGAGKLHTVGDVTPAITAGQLRKAWGAAHAVEKIGPQNEVWRYNEGLRWNGLFLFVVVVPIPAVLPAGRDSIEVSIENGWATKAVVREDTAVAAFGCFIGALPHAGGGGCGFGSIPKEDRWVRLTDGEAGLGYWRYRMINATDRRVSLVFTDYADQTQRLDLDPRQSMTIRSNNFGRRMALAPASGIPAHEISFAQDFPLPDRSFAYVITEHGFVVLPPQYRDQWETYPPVRNSISAPK